MNIKKTALPYLFVMPSVLFVIILVIYPLTYVIYMAFSKFTIEDGRLRFIFVGLRNFRDIFNTPSFHPTIYNTAIFLIFSVFGALMVSIILSLLINQVKRLRNFFRTLILFPWIVPLSVSGFMWKWILNDTYGILNHTLKQLSLTNSLVNWLGSIPLSMISLILVDIWVNCPLIILVLLTGIEQIPNEIIESAMIDGASFFQRIRYVMIPYIKMHIITVATIRTIFALRSFDLAYVLTGGGPGYSTNIAGLEIYMQGVRFLNINYASALSMLILAVTIVISLIIVKRSRKVA